MLIWMPNWLPIHVGKHSGKTIPQIVLADPDYFFWAIDEGVFDNKSAAIQEQAMFVDTCARAIPVKEGFVVQYYLHPYSGLVDRFEVVPEDQPLHQGGSTALRRPCIDLSFARTIADGMDKQGSKNLVTDLKRYRFGNSRYRLTRLRCEHLFDGLLSEG